MTGPGARLDAENANLQAYCDRLEAEIGPLRNRVHALELALNAVGGGTGTVEHENRTLRQQLRENLAALHCDRTAYPVGSMERTRCSCAPCKAWVATCIVLGMEART